MSETATLPAPAIEALDTHSRGTLLRPGEEGFEEGRRVWNGRIDRFPAAILRCAGAADVSLGVTIAREHNLPLSVKSGGCGLSGNAIRQDGLVLDLSSMNHVRVDPETERVHVGGGASWGAVNDEAKAFGLATAGTPRSHVGVAGFTLGGGVGPLARRFGLAIDDLVSVDVVTAEGDLIRASESRHPDLFWAIRGGDGNFGIVTSFTFECHDVSGGYLQGNLTYPFTAATDVVSGFREFMRDAPDAVGGAVNVYRLSEGPGVDSSARGTRAVSLYLNHFGDDPAGSDPFDPLRELGTVKVNDVDRRPHAPPVNSLYEAGERNYWEGLFLPTLSDEAIETFVEHAGDLPTTACKARLMRLGGAIEDVDPTATVFPHRDAEYLLTVSTQWSDPDEDESMIRWARGFREDMAPHATGGEFVNLQPDDDAHDVADAYGQNYDRLREVKREWDPTNVFDMNHTVDPNTD